MAFQNIVMPKLKLVHGVTKQVTDPVMVVGNGSRETRRKQNRYERFVWKFPARSILTESKAELYEFFKSTDAALDSFMMVDPDFPEFVNMPLTHRVNESGYENCWYFETPTGHPLFNHYDLTSCTFSVLPDAVGLPPVSAVLYHHVSGRPMIYVQDSYYYSDQLNNAPVTVNGPCYMTVRLNSALGWSISAMDKSPLGTTCSPTPLIVDMADIDY